MIFNAKEMETVLETLPYQHHLQNLVKGGTCFKNAEQRSCTDLFLTNSPLNFQNKTSMVTGFSDFPKIIPTVLKTTFAKTQTEEN